MEFVLKFADVEKEQLPQLGGKTWSLGQMSQQDFSVPPGFIVTSQSYRKFMEECGIFDWLKEESKDLASEKIQEFLENAQAKIREQTMPKSLAEKIVASYEQFSQLPVAVRSSATMEDSAQQSFAGQYETYLNITTEADLLESVIKCWASLWSYRVFAYHQDQEKLLEPGEISVVIQQMVPAQISGVLFTRDPFQVTGKKVLIDSCWGLGEAIVSGQATTDSYTVDYEKKEITSRLIRYKLVMCETNDQWETVYGKVPDEKRSISTLSDEQIWQLTDLALRIKNYYESDQDIEWAYDGEKFFILQSRPITTGETEEKKYDSEQEKFEDENAFISMMDTGEAFTGLFTPLGESFITYYQYNTHGALTYFLGMRDIGIAKKYVKFVYGRCYLNVGYFAWMYAQCLPFRDQSKFLIRFASEEIDVYSYDNPYGKGPNGWKYFLSNLFWLKCQVRDKFTLKGKADREIANREKELRRFRSLNLQEMALAQIHEELKNAYQVFHRACTVMVPFYIGSFAFYEILKDLCNKWLDDENGSIQKKLKAGPSDLRTLEVAEKIWEVTLEAKKSPLVKQTILETKAEETLAKLQQMPEAANFVEKFDEFLVSQGVRAHQEMELTFPRWLDDSTYLFNTMKTYLSNEDQDIAATITQAEKEREQVTEEIMKKLPWLKRKILWKVLNTYSRNSEVRESTRLCYTLGVWMTRKLVYEVGRRLIEQQVLKSEEEVAYLTYQDILRYSAGEGSAREIFPRSKIEKSHKTHLHNLRVPDPPLSIIGNWDPSQHMIKEFSGEVLEGVGSSTGCVSGKARIIRNLEKQVDEFQPGEILVTHFTDAAWTPLFNTAAAVVADLGSLLSHSSIVAREMGIPAVVNTKIGTQVIKTGDEIVVDGNTGKVHLKAK